MASKIKRPVPVSAANWPCEYETADVAAIQALTRGDATPDQMKRALLWIVQVAGADNEELFVPGDSEATAYYLGRRFVARQIVKLTKLNLQALSLNKETQ
jgi:hypothetical protein